MISSVESDLSCPVMCEIFYSPQMLLTGDREETDFNLEEDVVLDMIEHAKTKPDQKKGVLFVYLNTEITGYKKNKTLLKLVESYLNDHKDAQQYKPKERKVKQETPINETAQSALRARQETLFFRHVEEGNRKAVKVLIDEMNIDPHTALKDGQNALYYAKSPEMISQLQEYGLKFADDRPRYNNMAPKPSAPQLEQGDLSPRRVLRSSSVENLQGVGMFQPAPAINYADHLPVAVLCSRYGYDTALEDEKFFDKSSNQDKVSLLGSSVGHPYGAAFRVATDSSNQEEQKKMFLKLGGNKPLRIETFSTRFFLYDNSDSEEPKHDERITFVLIFSSYSTLEQSILSARKLFANHSVMDMKIQLLQCVYQPDGAVELVPCEESALINNPIRPSYHLANMSDCQTMFRGMLQELSYHMKYNLESVARYSQDVARVISKPPIEDEKPSKCFIQ